MPAETVIDPANDEKSAAPRTPPWWVWAVWAACAVVLILFHATTVFFRDPAFANVFSVPVVFFGGLVGGIWFVFFSGYGRGLRWGGMFGMLAVFALLATTLRIQHVSGELVPTFMFRWSKKPDERLALPEPPAPSGASAVDLATETPQDFPQFLGPKRAQSLPDTHLEPDWKAHPPKPLWKQPIGAGWSGFAVRNGFAVTQEQRGESELVTCYEVATGKLRWSSASKTRYETTIAGVGPRATPTLHGGKVYSLGATGLLRCLDGATGKPLWQVDVPQEFNATPDDEHSNLPYGRSNSPLIVDGRVIIPAGGASGGPYVSLAAFNADDGEYIGEGGARQISCSSPALASLGGVRQILSVNEDTVSGHDPGDLRELWSHPWPGSSNASASVSQPVAVPPDQVFVSKGYGVGAALLKLTPNDGGGFSVDEVWRDEKVLNTKFTNVSVKDGYAYGLSDGTLECLELATGKSVWKQGRYYQGQILRVGAHLIIMSEDGEVYLVDATPEHPNRVLGSFTALEGKTWNNPTLYGRYLLVRNAEQAACYELSLKATPEP